MDVEREHKDPNVVNRETPDADAATEARKATINSMRETVGRRSDAKFTIEEIVAIRDRISHLEGDPEKNEEALKRLNDELVPLERRLNEAQKLWDKSTPVQRDAGGLELISKTIAEAEKRRLDADRKLNKAEENYKTTNPELFERLRAEYSRVFDDASRESLKYQDLLNK